jgi:lipopolysaccharide biosynthesis protein
MLGKFGVFAESYAEYDLVLFLHSKRTLHLKGGEHDWLSVLTQSLCGSPETVDSIFSLFDTDLALGIVFPEHYEPIRSWLSWGSNWRRSRGLASRMGITLQHAEALDFPSGSMFWARPAALRPILDLGLNANSFPPECGQIDGTIAHALERLILYSAEKAGFRWLKVGDLKCYRDHAKFISVDQPDQLESAMSRGRSSLLI